MIPSPAVWLLAPSASEYPGLALMLFGERCSLQLKLAASLRSAIALRACRGGRASFAQDQTKVTKADKHRPLVWILLPAGHRARDFTKLYLCHLPLTGNTGWDQG